MSQYVTTPDGRRHIFPNEATPAQIKAALASYAAPDTGKPIMVPAPMGLSQPKAMVATNPFISYGLRALPTIGGAVGGFLGSELGPGAIGTAAVGGSAGEGIRQAILNQGYGQPISPLAIGGRGVEQGAYEVTGFGLARGAGALAKPVMRRALGVGKTLLSNFPDAVETALSKGIPVSTQGVAKAKALRQASGQALSDLLIRARNAGTTFRMADITRQVKVLLRSKVLPERDKDRILRQVVEFAVQRSQKIDPVLLNEIKRFYQARASSVYRAGRAGALTLAQENRGLFSRALARGAREQLETIPGVAERNVETQSLIGAQRAVSEAVMRPPRPFEIHKPGSYPIANNPYVVSRVALTLNSPMFRSLLRQSPRAAAALMMELVHVDEPDVTRAQ